MLMCWNMQSYNAQKRATHPDIAQGTAAKADFLDSLMTQTLVLPSCLAFDALKSLYISVFSVTRSSGSEIHDLANFWLASLWS